jgi:hypothetical protein
MTDVKDDPDAAGVDAVVLLQLQNRQLLNKIERLEVELEKSHRQKTRLHGQLEETVTRLKEKEEQLLEMTRGECEAAMRDHEDLIKLQSLQAQYTQLEEENKRLTLQNLAMQRGALELQKELRAEFEATAQIEARDGTKKLRKKVTALQAQISQMNHTMETDKRFREDAQACAAAAISEMEWKRRENKLSETCMQLKQQVADLRRERDEARLQVATEKLYHQGAEQAFKDRDEFQRQNARLVQSSLDVKKQLKQSQQELQDAKNIIAHQQQQLQKLQQLCAEMKQYNSTKRLALDTPICQAQAEVEKMRLALNDLQQERALQQQQQQADKQELRGRLENVLQRNEEMMQEHSTFVAFQRWRTQCKQMTLQSVESLVEFQHRRAHQLRFLLQWRETKRVQARDQRDLSQYNEGWRIGRQVAQERADTQAYDRGRWDGWKLAFDEVCRHFNTAAAAMNNAALNMGPRPSS